MEVESDRFSMCAQFEDNATCWGIQLGKAGKRAGAVIAHQVLACSTR